MSPLAHQTRKRTNMQNDDQQTIWRAIVLALGIIGAAVFASRAARGDEPERPELKYGTPTAVECYKTGYATGPCTGHMTMWVAWHVTPEKLKNPVPRKGFPFKADPDTPREFRITPRDYNHSGDDRGHISPFADNAWSKDAAADSMSMRNMMPQAKKLNEGHTKWEGLEAWHRDEAKNSGATYLSFAGPAFIPDEEGVIRFRVIGAGAAWEPTHCWRTSVIEYGDKLTLKTWLMPNIDDSPDFTECEISCDQLEQEVGLDFWKKLPGAEKLEAKEPAGEETE